MFNMSSVFEIQRALVAYIVRPNARLCRAYLAAREHAIVAPAWRGPDEDLTPRLPSIAQHVRCGNYVTVHMRFGDRGNVNEGPHGDNVMPYYNALQRLLCTVRGSGDGQEPAKRLDSTTYPLVFYSTDEPRAEAK